MSRCLAELIKRATTSRLRLCRLMIVAFVVVVVVVSPFSYKQTDDDRNYWRCRRSADTVFIFFHTNTQQAAGPAMIFSFAFSHSYTHMQTHWPPAERKEFSVASAVHFHFFFFLLALGSRERAQVSAKIASPRPRPHHKKPPPSPFCSLHATNDGRERERERQLSRLENHREPESATTTNLLSGRRRS